ncbi:hypothetical protein C4588_06145 [Candidatus Parcubacteria bacterium]|jgi:hypothetical protein|nr:MAG: hypothetical protein C4588_06145 [Candidatus Parcubacteria bacterium]
MKKEYEVKTTVFFNKKQPDKSCTGCCFFREDYDCQPSIPSDPCNLCGDSIFVKRYELVRIK